jgi:probable DNA repair protein
VRHDESCLARGLEVWATPDIVTWDELIERLFALDRQAGCLDGRWLPTSGAQLIWERMVRDDPDLDPLVSSAGVARAAYQSWRRLHDYRIPLDALDGGDSPETAAFARWCRQYLQLLDTRGWVDPALAAPRVQAPTATPGLEIVGFDRLTPLQEATLERWAATGLQVHRASPPQATAAAGHLRCLDAAAEVDAAARWAAAALHERSDRRLAIVVPDLGRRREVVRRTVERVMVPATGMTGGPAPESDAFELAGARPLAEQPLIAAALDLLDAFVRPSDLQALSRLLRNPFLGGFAAECAARARLDARLRRFEEQALGLIGLERMAEERGCPLLAASLAAGRDVISKWAEKEHPSVCSNNLFSLLAALGWPGAGLDSAAHQAAERWRSLVSEFGACDEFTGRVSRTEAVAMLREMAGRVLFEPQELRAPLLVIDPETSAGMTFDALWVCGLDATRWPPPAAPDPFLPRNVQVRHGLPHASAQLAAEESRRVFTRLLASAGEVIVSVPEVDDDAPLLPSPLLDAIALMALPQQWPEARLAADQYARRPELEVAVDGQLPPVTADEARRGGARLLELQSACPFRAQTELRLGARALDEPGLGVDAAERGDLVHRALAVLWQTLGSQAALQALDAEGLESVVRRAVDTALDEARRTADALLRHLLELEAEWLEGRVLAMIAADLARPPFVIAEVEATCTAQIGPLSLELRPDRVDRLADGSLAVIDYKTGGDAEVKAWLEERPRLPQLPAYVQALGAANVAAVAFARVRSGDTGYVGVARTTEAFPGLRVPGSPGLLKEFGTWDELLGAWRRRLDALAVEYAAGDARLAPNPPRACEYCHLGALCRIAETQATRSAEEGDDE